MHTVAKYNFLFKNHVLSMISILARKIQIQCWRLGVDLIKIEFLDKNWNFVTVCDGQLLYTRIFTSS